MIYKYTMLAFFRVCTSCLISVFSLKVLGLKSIVFVYTKHYELTFLFLVLFLGCCGTVVSVIEHMRYLALLFSLKTTPFIISHTVVELL